MTPEDLADLIRADSANTNGRIDEMRNEANAALTNIRIDLPTMQKQIDLLTAEVADLKRRA